MLGQGVQGITDLIDAGPDQPRLRRRAHDHAGRRLGPDGDRRGRRREPAAEAAKNAVSSPLLEQSVEGATGILLNITGGSDLGLFEVNEAAEIIQGAADQNSNIIFGAVVDDARRQRARDGDRHRLRARRRTPLFTEDSTGRPARAAPPRRHDGRPAARVARDLRRRHRRPVPPRARSGRSPPDTALAFEAMRELRTHYEDEADFVRASTRCSAEGYRLVGAFEDERCVAVAGFRVIHNLAWGDCLYVDDLHHPDGRRRGWARLLEWCAAEPARLGCGELHLDSGVGPDREDAHRLYFNTGLRITSSTSRSRSRSRPPSAARAGGRARAGGARGRLLAVGRRRRRRGVRRARHAFLPPEAEVERPPCSTPGYAPDLLGACAAAARRVLLLGHLDTVVAHARTGRSSATATA